MVAEDLSVDHHLSPIFIGGGLKTCSQVSSGDPSSVVTRRKESCTSINLPLFQLLLFLELSMTP